MKKIILSVAVVVLGFAATSCKKYTCTCRDINSGAVISTSSTSASTEAGAIIKCEDKSTGAQECD